MLQDRFHRKHDYLRISLTDNCNFRCTYCMPNEIMDSLPNHRLMQPDEIISISKTFVELGITKIRLTGGEPLIRKEFSYIISHLSKLPVKLTLTTNGVLLHEHLELFKSVGINSLNISLDTLIPEKFFSLTKRNEFDRVWNNILLFLDNKFSVKVNVVVMKTINEDEIINFVNLTKNKPLHIRFIEYMPFDKNGWDKEKVVLSSEILVKIKETFEVIKLEDAKHDTAKKYKIEGFSGTFAFITTMSQPFCEDCNRIRITADGKMKNCLFGKDELDILGAYRKNENIETLIQKSLQLKHEKMGGQFDQNHMETDPTLIENRSMLKIGG